MILKEDYFKDLDLTDDDIDSSDDNYYNTDTDDYDYANGKEYYNAMSSKYSHYMFLGIQADNTLTDSELWTDKVPHMLKRLFYLFDLYGIEYSTPVVTEPAYRVHDLIDDKFEDCKFFDFDEYKVITTYDTLDKLIEWEGI